MIYTKIFEDNPNEEVLDEPIKEDNSVGPEASEPVADEKK